MNKIIFGLLWHVIISLGFFLSYKKKRKKNWKKEGGGGDIILKGTPQIPTKNKTFNHVEFVTFWSQFVTSWSLLSSKIWDKLYIPVFVLNRSNKNFQLAKEDNLLKILLLLTIKRPFNIIFWSSLLKATIKVELKNRYTLKEKVDYKGGII